MSTKASVVSEDLGYGRLHVFQEMFDESAAVFVQVCSEKSLIEVQIPYARAKGGFMPPRKSLADRAMAAWWDAKTCTDRFLERHNRFIRLSNQWHRQAEKQKKGKEKRGK
jgi:hypothetical protein